jgi:hypothetical protein
VTVRLVPLWGTLPVPKKPVLRKRVSSPAGTVSGAVATTTWPEGKCEMP